MLNSLQFPTFLNFFNPFTSFLSSMGNFGLFSSSVSKNYSSFNTTNPYKSCSQASDSLFSQSSFSSCMGQDFFTSIFESSKNRTSTAGIKKDLDNIKYNTKSYVQKGQGIDTKGIKIDPSTNQNAQLWKSLGYNAERGERLANTVLNNAVGFTGYCAKYVKAAIQKAGLGEYEYGHAYQMPEILDNNSHFKRISPEGVDVNKLPAGCVLVYGRGVAGYSSEYGHTEITTGTGKAISDGITNHIRRNPTAIFIPV